MIPAALVGILAVNRLGAIHATVFGGFAPTALAQRIDASRPVVVLTASCGIVDSVKPPVAYRDFVTAAVRRSDFKPPRTIVWQREQLRWEPLRRDTGERVWQKLVASARNRGVKAACVPVRSDEVGDVSAGPRGLPALRIWLTLSGRLPGAASMPNGR